MPSFQVQQPLDAFVKLVKIRWTPTDSSTPTPFPSIRELPNEGSDDAAYTMNRSS